MALLINGRWEKDESGKSFYRLDFLQMPHTLTVALTDMTDIQRIHLWVKKRYGDGVPDGVYGRSRAL